MAGYQTANGSTVDMTGGFSRYYGADGKEYATMAAAENASKMFNKAAYGQTAPMSRSAELVREVQARKATAKPSQTDDLTKEFLSKWGGINEKALSSLDKIVSGEMPADFPGSEQLQGLISQIGEQSKSFEQQYGGLEKASVEASMEDIANRRKLTGQYMDLARPDYAGAVGRAAADARSAGARAAGAQARQAMAYGIDPTSLKFGALTRKSVMDTARNEAMAMNVARRGEKERLTGITERGMQLIDPSKSYSMASDIAGKKAGLIGQQANLQLASTGAAMDLNKMRADAAMRMADIGSQYGSAGMTMLGINKAQNPTATKPEIPGTTPELPTVQSLNMSGGSVGVGTPTSTTPKKEYTWGGTVPTETASWRQ